jgi:hypothetical protein
VCCVVWYLLIHYQTVGLLYVVHETACVIHIIQDKSYVQTDLWLTALNFIGLLLSEESKLKGRLDQNADIAFVASQLDCLQIACELSSTIVNWGVLL